MRILDLARHRAHNVEREQPRGTVTAGDQAGRRPKANDPAEGGRRPQAPPIVRTRRERYLAKGQRDSGASRRAATGLRWIERVSSGSEQTVRRVAAGAKFRRVCFGQNDAVGLANVGDAALVLRRNSVLEEQRTSGGCQPR